MEAVAGHNHVVNAHIFTGEHIPIHAGGGDTGLTLPGAEVEDANHFLAIQTAADAQKTLVAGIQGRSDSTAGARRNRPCTFATPPEFSVMYQISSFNMPVVLSTIKATMIRMAANML